MPDARIHLTFPDYGTKLTDAACFDSRVVLGLLKRKFAEELGEISDDLAWEDYESFLAMEDASAALETAERDAQRRGPRFRFQLRSGDATLWGAIERHSVSLWGDPDIPPELSASFEAFLRELPLGKPELRIEPAS